MVLDSSQSQTLFQECNTDTVSLLANQSVGKLSYKLDSAKENMRFGLGYNFFNEYLLKTFLHRAPFQVPQGYKSKGKDKNLSL